MDPIWRSDIIKIDSHEIRYTEVFEVADAKMQKYREILIS